MVTLELKKNHKTEIYVVTVNSRLLSKRKKKNILGYYVVMASLVAKMVKSLPTMQETRVRSLGWKVPLYKGMATHCGILAWRIPWKEEPDAL